MGCWNKTCGLTNLPIYHGDKVVTFLIVESPYQDSMCYNNALWQLIPLPIYGEYNDYGWMDEDDGQEWKLEVFQKWAEGRLVRDKPYEKDSGYVRYPDLKDSPFESFKALGDSMHGQVFSFHYRPAQKNCRIQHFMVHADTFEEMSKEFHTDSYYEIPPVPKETFIKDYTDFVEELKTINSESDVIADELLERQNAGQKLTPEELKAVAAVIIRRINSGYAYDVISSFLKKRYPDIEYDWHIPSRGVLSRWFSSRGSSEGFITSDFCNEAKDIPAKDAVDGWFIDYLFMNLRKQFIPMGHEGSQDGITKVNQLFAQSYLKRIQAYNERFGEDEEFEDEESDEESDEEE